jgi:hypothetical protein
VSVDAADVTAVSKQLGRPPRGMQAVAHRCPCGLPDVIETAPRLPDGTPFPTLYYLTCVRACAAASRLEAGGLMRDMTARLADDDALQAAYLAAHRDYARKRGAAAATAGVPGEVPARAGRARARRARDKPVRPRGHTGDGTVVGGGAVRGYWRS